MKELVKSKSKSEVIKKLSEINNKIRNNTYELIENNNLEELINAPILFDELLKYLIKN